MPKIWEMPTAATPLTGLERLPMNQGGGADAVKNVPLLVSGPPFGGPVLVLDAPMVADTASSSESDPGAGLIRWNDADPHDSTEIYVSHLDNESANLSAALGALEVGGVVYVQGSADADALSNLQRWHVTGKRVEAGYTALEVTWQAGAGSFTDGDSVWVTLQQPVPAPGVDRNLVTAVGSSGGNLVLNASLGDYFTITLTESVDTVTITNVPAACTLGLWITQAAGQYGWTWPGSFDWGADGNAPDVSGLADGDVMFVVISTVDAGGTWDASARVRG